MAPWTLPEAENTNPLLEGEWFFLESLHFSSEWLCGLGMEILSRYYIPTSEKLTGQPLKRPPPSRKFRTKYDVVSLELRVPANLRAVSMS